MKCLMYESALPQYRLSTDFESRGEPIDIPDDLYHRFEAAAREYSIACADLLCELRRKR